MIKQNHRVAFTIIALVIQGTIHLGHAVPAAANDSVYAPPVSDPAPIPAGGFGDFTHRPSDVEQPEAPVRGPSRPPRRSRFLAASSVEEEEKRTERSKLFRNADGSFTMRSFSGPVHFKGPDGRWKEIESKLVPTAEGYSTDGPMKVRFGREAGSGHLLQVETSLGAMTIDPRGTVKSKALAGDRRIKYPDVMKDVDLEYEIGAFAVKELLIVKRPPAAEEALNVSFDVEMTSSLEASPLDGGLVFRAASGAIAFQIPPPVMWDASNLDGSGVSREVSLDWLPSGAGGGTITLRVASAWLNDPSRSYPVTIDPTVTIGEDTNRSDASVSEGAPSSNFNANLDPAEGTYVNKIGWEDPTNQQQWAHVVFDLTPINNAEIWAAYWHGCFLYNRSQGSSFYRLQPLSDYWNASNVTWNTKPSWIGSDFIDDWGAEGQCRDFDMTSWVRNWTKGAWPNYGLVLHTGSSDPSTATQPLNFKKMAAAESPYGPYIEVDFNYGPTQPVISSPVTGTVITVDNPTIYFSSTDPDNDPLTYHAYLSSRPDAESGNLLESGGLLNNSWAIPTGHLVDGQTYYVKVRAFDGAAWSPWSSVTQFKMDLGLGKKEVSAYDEFGPLSINLRNGNVMTSVSSPSVKTVGGSIGVQFSYNSLEPRPKGLTGAYFVSDSAQQWLGSPVVVKTDGQMSFNWGLSSPFATMPEDYFNVRWAGYLTPTSTAAYNFGARSDDGVKIWLNDQVVHDKWQGQAMSPTPEYGASVVLQAGVPVPIKIEYFEYVNVAALEVWAKQGESQFLLPANWLSPVAPALPAGWNLSQDVDGSLAYTSAKVSDGSVVLTDSSGAAHAYTWNGSGWVPPSDEQGILTREASGMLQLLADDSNIYRFNSTGTLVDARSTLDDRAPAAPRFEYAPVGEAGLQRLSAVLDPVSGRRMRLTYAENALGTNCPAPPQQLERASAYVLCKVDMSEFGLGETRLFFSNKQLAQVVQAKGGSTTRTDFVYADGRLVEAVDPFTNELIDANAFSSDPEHRYSIEYQLGRATRVRGPKPSVVASRLERLYDYGVDERTKVIDPGMTPPPASGYLRMVEFDPTTRRKTAEYNTAGTKERFVWDGSNDRLVERWIGNDALKTTYVYDAGGRLTETYGPGVPSEFSGKTSTTAPLKSTAYDEQMNGLSSAWWSNKDLVGPSALHGTFDGSEDWGGGTPDPSLTGAFSGRFTGEIEIPGGGVSWLGADVGATEDDSVSVYIDDKATLSRWDSMEEAILRDSPYSFFRLGESAGPSAVNLAGGSCDGVYVGGTSAPSLIDHDPSAARAFDGVDDKMGGQICSGTQRPRNNFSFELWLSPAGADQVDSQSTSGYGGTSGQHYAVSPDQPPAGNTSDSWAGLSAGNNVVSVYEHGSDYMPPLLIHQTPIAPKTHVVVNYVNKVPTLYINGVMARKGPASPRANVYAPLTVGSGPYGAFGGSIDEFAVYDHALSDSRIKAHYDSGRASLTKEVAIPAGTHRMRVDYKDPSGMAKLELKWKLAGSSTESAIPLSNLKPRFNLSTSSSDRVSATQTKRTSTSFADPVLGLPTGSTDDPGGLNLQTTKSYESAPGGFLRLVARTLPKGAGTSVGYDYYGATETVAGTCGATSAVQAGALKVKTAADPDGAGAQTPIKTEYRYDAAGRVIAERSTAGILSSENWECTRYDDRGRVASRVDRSGVSTDYDYSLPTQTVATEPDSSGVSHSLVSETDWIGRVVSYKDEQGTTTRTSYDQAGRVLITYRTLAGGSEVGLTQREYDSNGRLWKLSETTSGVPRTTVYTYDSMGRVRTEARPVGPNFLTTEYEYSADRGWLSGLVTRLGGTTVHGQTLTRDLTGRIIAETSGGKVKSYLYDNAGRLTKVNDDGVVRDYSYDADSNRCSTSSQGCDNSFVYDDADRILSSPTAASYGYDAHGNITNATLRTQPGEASITREFPFDASNSTSPIPTGIVVGGPGTFNGGLAFTTSSIPEVNRSGNGGSGAGSIAPGQTKSASISVDGESYITSQLSWPQGNHATSSSFAGTVDTSASHTISPTAAGDISSTVDWAPSTKAITTSSHSEMGTQDFPFTVSASGSIEARLSSPETVRTQVCRQTSCVWVDGPNTAIQKFQLVESDTGIVVATSTPTGNREERLTYQVTGVQHPSTKSYNFQILTSGAETDFTFTRSWPVTADVDLELWRGTTIVASSTTATAKPEHLSAASLAPGTYTLKIISKDHQATYNLSSSYQVLAHANLSFRLKDPAGQVVTQASSSGTATLASLVTAGGSYTFEVTNNSSDLQASSFSMPWTITTLSRDSASGSLDRSPATYSRQITADGPGYLSSTLTWQKGTHPVTSSLSSGVAGGAVSTSEVVSTDRGTVSASVDWSPTTYEPSWQGEVGPLGTYERSVTATASGTLTARVDWSAAIPNPDLDIYLIDPVGGGALRQDTDVTGNSGSISYPVPSSVGYTSAKRYILRVAAKAQGSSFTLSSSVPVTPELDLEIYRGGSMVASSLTTSSKPESASATDQPAGTYSIRVISRDHAATYSLSTTYQVLAHANLTFKLKNGSSTIVTTTAGDGSATLETSIGQGGPHTLEVINNSSDLVVPAFDLSTIYPGSRLARMKLYLTDGQDNTLAITQGQSARSVTSSVTQGSYTLWAQPLSGSGTATLTATFPARPNLMQIAYDHNDHATSIDDGTNKVQETLSPSGRVIRRLVTDSITGQVIEDDLYGYEDPADSPSYIKRVSDGRMTTYINGVSGLIATDTQGSVTYPVVNAHGDVVGVVGSSGSYTQNPVQDEFGKGDAPDDRLGWLGAKQRYSTGGELHLIRMGVRLYDPALGRFLQVDPVEGGNSNDYTYPEDPVNEFDLDGRHKHEPPRLSGRNPSPPRTRGNWRRVHVDMNHIKQNHLAKFNPLPGKTVFPSHLNTSDLKFLIRSSYSTGLVLRNQGSRQLIEGAGIEGFRIQMWYNRSTGMIESAWPVRYRGGMPNL